MKPLYQYEYGTELDDFDNKVVELWKSNNSVFEITDKLKTTIPMVVKSLSKIGWGIPNSFNDKTIDDE